MGLCGGGLRLQRGGSAQCAERCRPHVVHTDIRMDEMVYLQLVESQAQWQPECRVVVLSEYSDIEYFAGRCSNPCVLLHSASPTKVRILRRIFNRASCQLDEDQAHRERMSTCRSNSSESGRRAACVAPPDSAAE
jgi:DNA-binding NarL/FixJ family response regulator